MDARFDPVIETEAARFGASYVVKSADLSEVLAWVSQILTEGPARASAAVACQGPADHHVARSLDPGRTVRHLVLRQLLILASHSGPTPVSAGT